MNEKVYDNLEINISDSNGILRDMKEVIDNLKKLQQTPHAMSSHILFLQGEQHMLDKIIKYLGKI